MKIIKQLIEFIIISLILISLGSAISAAENTEKSYVYRLYNPSSSEHLYTVSREEVNSLVRSGAWKEEGIGWGSPKNGEPVYRIYSPQLTDHLYSTDTNEVETLCAHHGWVKDFNGSPIFYSGGSINVFRLYNPQNGRHHLTTDENEYNVLPGSGWQQEGIKLSCLSGFDPYLSPSAVADRILAQKANYPEDMPWNNDNEYYSSALNEKGWGCHAFALILSDAGFGDLKGRRHNNTGDIRVGDVLRVDSSGKPDNHSVIVTGIDGDTLTLAEGNWQNDIHWGRRVKVSELQITYILTRYPE